MKKELANKLYLRFPDIFIGCHKPLTESLMAFGIEVGDGWFDLIYEMCEEIESIAILEDVPLPVAVQVKEKIGELRFYASGATKNMFDCIENTKDRSVEICEICGKEGKLLTNKNRWMKTRCQKHETN